MSQRVHCVTVNADGTTGKCNKVAKWPEDEPKFCGNHKYNMDGDKKPAPNSDKKDKERPKLMQGSSVAEVLRYRVL